MLDLDIFLLQVSQSALSYFRDAVLVFLKYTIKPLHNSHLGESLSLLFQFPVLENHGIQVRVRESHGKVIIMLSENKKKEN